MALTIEAIVYEGARDSSNRPLQQLSNLMLTGLSTADDTLNSDSGTLYGSFSYSSLTYTFTLYSDSARTQSVASGTASALGAMTLVAQNNSGISGSINLVSCTVNDANIQCICFFSKDDDLQMLNLETLTDYDVVNGFAEFHLKAFQEIVKVVKNRYNSLLFDPARVDANTVPSANGYPNPTGGYALSKVKEWTQFREPSAYYALYLIAERQAISKDSYFDMKWQSAKRNYDNYMNTINVPFDLNVDRIVDKTRSFRTFKVGRA